MLSALVSRAVLWDQALAYAQWGCRRTIKMYAIWLRTCHQSTKTFYYCSKIQNSWKAWSLMLELVLLGELAICSLWLLKGTVSSKSTGSLVCTESVAGQPCWIGDLRITGPVKYHCGCHIGGIISYLQYVKPATILEMSTPPSYNIYNKSSGCHFYE